MLIKRCVTMINWLDETGDYISAYGRIDNVSYKG